MRRRCLQSERAQRQNIAMHRSGFWSPNSPASSKGSEVSESRRVEGSSISRQWQLDKLNLPNTHWIYPSNCGNPNFTDYSINPVPVGRYAASSMISAATGSFNAEGNRSLSFRDCHILDQRNSSSFADLLEKDVIETKDGSRETLASRSLSYGASLPNQVAKTLNNPVLQKPTESQEILNDEKSNSEASNTFETKPEKKRRTETSNRDGGSPHCKCKKTKCLKLYCDCFAAGFHCNGLCACQECYNTSDYEDTVDIKRDQIGERNPLAFARKEDRILSTPSSVRHKRGCNCKKSMCMKRYCECYQANVGCSIGCRCVGCKNIYGSKNEYGAVRNIESEGPISERLEAAFNERLETEYETRNELLNSQSSTPRFQSARSHGNDTPRFSISPSGQYGPSHDSNHAIFPPHSNSHGSLRNSGAPDTLKTGQGILDNAESTLGRLSPRGARRDLTHPYITNDPDPSLMAMASLMSTQTRHPGNVFGGNSLPTSESGRQRKIDNTPKIPWDVSTPPTNDAKISCSPSKMSASPPHPSPRSCLGEIGRSSGHEFIIRAMPCFQSFTSSLHCGDNVNQNTNDPKECRCNAKECRCNREQ